MDKAKVHKVEIDKETNTYILWTGCHYMEWIWITLIPGVNYLSKKKKVGPRKILCCKWNYNEAQTSSSLSTSIPSWLKLRVVVGRRIKWLVRILDHHLYSRKNNCWEKFLSEFSSPEMLIIHMKYWGQALWRGWNFGLWSEKHQSLYPVLTPPEVIERMKMIDEVGRNADRTLRWIFGPKMDENGEWRLRNFTVCISHLIQSGWLNLED